MIIWFKEILPLHKGLQILKEVGIGYFTKVRKQAEK